MSADYKSDAVLVAELLRREPFYSLTGQDGCLCAHIRLRQIDIDVHCWRSSHFFNDYYGEQLKCNCQFVGVHLTPLEPSDEAQLIELGKTVREQTRRLDADIVIHPALNRFEYVGVDAPPKGERPPETVIAGESPSEVLPANL